MLEKLHLLGFVDTIVDGMQAIIPPVCEVPAGEFVMGSDKQRDQEARDDETPQHRVTQPITYSIGTFPVTVAEYARAVKAQAVREPSGSVDWTIQLQQAEHPVVCVSWHDAMTYATWLSTLTGDTWQLPTEAEWEKAARGTDGRIYPWGNTWDKARANTADGGPSTTTPVGAYADQGDASPYGVHDLAGNVWEWCHSLFEKYPYHRNDGRESESDATNNRVLHGGAWINSPQEARMACRDISLPDSVYSNYGFRLVRRGAD